MLNLYVIWMTCVQFKCAEKSERIRANNFFHILPLTGIKNDKEQV